MRLLQTTTLRLEEFFASSAIHQRHIQYILITKNNYIKNIFLLNIIIIKIIKI
jgi:hypothetical protein